MAQQEVYQTMTNWVWLSIKHLPNGNYFFALVKRMKGKNSPYSLLVSEQYRDLLLCFCHAKYLLDFSTRLVHEVEVELKMTDKYYYYEFKSLYYALLQRDFFESGGVHFSIFPLSTTAERLERKFKLCLDEQTRKTRLHRQRMATPTPINELWRELNSFDFGTGDSYLQSK